MTKTERKNRYMFGLGTIGRDMFYSLESMYLLMYLTEVKGLSNVMLAWVGGVLTFMRIFDAVNDPIMGVFVDNTHSKYGKFKPWILMGGIVCCVMLLFLFADLPVDGALYVVLFALFYLLWDISYGVNDIAFWSMLPTLSMEQSGREKIGAFARICANLGMYTVVVGVLPITGAMTKLLGDGKTAWFLFAVIICALMLGFQCFTLFGVKENKTRFKEEEKTSLKEMFYVLFRNDQLMWTAVSMILFMIGYCTTANFGTYFFIYAYGDAGMYPVFAGVLGLSQVATLLVFPLVAKKFERKQIYTFATVLVLLGYLVFFFSPMNMIPISIAGLLLFVGQAFIQTLMLMFLTDTIEYGQWKLGKRNESITFSIQPLINKLGGAIATGVVTITLIFSGINGSANASEVTQKGISQLKFAMLILPLISIICGYVVYRRKYKIDRAMYSELIEELTKRGDIHL